MPDATTTTETTESTTTETAPGTETVDAAKLEADLEKWKAQARKHEERAKANADAAKELEQLRQQHMTDQEKAVAEAKAAGRAEALIEVGGQLVAAEVKVAAAGRLDDDAIDGLLEGLDLAKFIDPDGKVNQGAVKAFVDRIAPKPDENGGGVTFPDLGQGARGGTSTALNGDPLLRDLKSTLRIR